MNLILFDFDHTLTKKDSFISFLKYTSSPAKLVLKSVALSPFMLVFKFGLYSSENFKKRVLKSFFFGYNKNKLEALGKSFSQNQIPHILNPSVYKKMLNHINKGDKVLVVSASLNLWLTPWCKEHKIGLVCTKIEFDNEVFTGEFKTKNCKGMEKVNRLNRDIIISDYKEVIVYGNKGLDKEMFTLASSEKNIHVI